MIKIAFSLLLLPLIASAGTEIYTKTAVVGTTQTVKEVENSLIDDIRTDAINKTGVYIKKTSSLDENQKLEQETSTTVARLVRIEELSADQGPNGLLTVKARVTVDDNELKNLVSNEQKLDIARKNNAVLQNQIGLLIRQNMVMQDREAGKKRQEATKDREKLVAEVTAKADSLATNQPLPANLNITLGDLTDGVPTQLPETSKPVKDVSESLEHSCRFFKSITRSITQSGVQNNLKLNLVKVIASYTEVRLKGTVSWDWSQQINLIKEYLGPTGWSDDGKVFGFEVPMGTVRQMGWLNCEGIPFLAVKVLNVNAIDGYESMYSNRDFNSVGYTIEYRGSKSFDQSLYFYNNMKTDDLLSKNIVLIDFKNMSEAEQLEYYNQFKIKNLELVKKVEANAHLASCQSKNALFSRWANLGWKGRLDYGVRYSKATKNSFGYSLVKDVSCADFECASPDNLDFGFNRFKKDCKDVYYTKDHPAEGSLFGYLHDLIWNRK